MSELAILMARVLPIPKFSTTLLKFLLKIFASSLLWLIVLLLLFKIIDYLWKALSETKGPTVFQKFLLSETILSSGFPKNVSQSKLAQKFLQQLKRLLDFSFLDFKNLFLSFDLLIIDFLSCLATKLQLFERIHISFILERACQEQIIQYN